MGYLRELQMRRAEEERTRGRMNLQLFAGEGEQDAGEHEDADGNDEDDEEESDEGQDGKSFTQKDVDRLIQKVRREERRKAEEAAKKAKTEAEKLARMTAEEKAKHEAEAREAKLTERENELNRRELRAQAAETLSEKSLPNALLDVLDYADANACQKSIEKMEKAWSKAVQSGVEERLKGKPPKRENGRNEDSAPKSIADALREKYKK